MMRVLAQLISQKKEKEEKAEEEEVGHKFDAFEFYKNLQAYKQSAINTELGENNNAAQNLCHQEGTQKFKEAELARKSDCGLQKVEEKKHDHRLKRVTSNEQKGTIVKLNEKTKFTSEMVPNCLKYKLAVDSTRIYGGRFTSKGNLYYCSSQDIIGIFNSSNPYNMKKVKTVNGLDINWTITSMDTTEDEEYLVYSSISPFLHIVDLQTLCKFHQKINLSESETPYWGYEGFFGIFNCKFSGDGKELL
jgi:hypothetical protein